MAQDVLERIVPSYGPDGLYGYELTFSADAVSAKNFRLRLFFDAEQGGRGLCMSTDNPDDRVFYEDWNTYFRPPTLDGSASGPTRAFNVEMVCEFAAGKLTRRVFFHDPRGGSVLPRGESFISHGYAAGNLPVNVLLERRVSSCGIVRATFDPDTSRVTVVTDGPHGFATGEAVTVSGFPSEGRNPGVNGERYNGTFVVDALSDDTFSYRTEFYKVDTEYTTCYQDVDNLVAEKWIVCEYTVEKPLVLSSSEAAVLWNGHGFRISDRLTLALGDVAVARDATITEVAPNSFICVAPGITPETVVDSIVYAPRTPRKDVPVNYSVAQVPTQRKSRSRGAAPLMLTNNAGTSEANTTTLGVTRFAWFDLYDGQGYEQLDGTLKVGTGKFGVFTFYPDAGMGMSDGNKFKIEIPVLASTEVSTSLVVSLVKGGWDSGDTASTLWANVDRVPDSGNDLTDDTCVYGDETLVFQVEDGDRICRSGTEVTMAVYLDGREGATVELDGSGVDIMQWIEEDSWQEGFDMMLDPVSATEGDTVSVLSLATHGRFPLDTSIIRVDVNGIDCDVMSSSGDRITFIMPGGVSGTLPVTVEYKSGDEWFPIPTSHQMYIEAVVNRPRQVQLNEKIAPGTSGRTVSRSALYNRDLGINGFCEVTDENSLIQNMYACLLTRKGERLFNPDFGTHLESMIFSLRGELDEEAILKECFTALEKYEPRITLVYEQCSVEEYGNNGIVIILGVVLPGGLRRTLRLPFKHRGVLT